jgi:hypothetical protein
VVAARITRRLPGFRFEAQTTPLDESLPRMDVAVFIGFASSGPLNRPVPIEDATQFADTFGADAPLAWDGRRGERVYAYLGPAVRAFFRNGGRRCWVVRVAGRARQNLFPIPGLARVRTNGQLTYALARARAHGSWSDALRVSATLNSRPVIVTKFVSLGEFYLELNSPDEVIPGDLLRLTSVEGVAALVAVDEVTPLTVAEQGLLTGTPQARRINVRVRGGAREWFQNPGPPPPVLEGEARVQTFSGYTKAVSAQIAHGSAWSRGETIKPEQQIILDLKLPHAEAPAPGAFARVRFDEHWLWLRVDDVRVLGQQEEAGDETVQVSGPCLWWLSSGSHSLSGTPVCEKLLFELRVRQGGADPVTISDLGFTSRHPRFWGALPVDEQLYPALNIPVDTPHRPLWQEVTSPRFPLAGRYRELKDTPYFPVLMPGFTAQFLRPLRRHATALERDGLSQFASDIFLDRQLRETGLEDLLSHADFIRYQSSQPRSLTGIYAALEIEEATIVVVPDAAHRGWETRVESPATPAPSAYVPHPEWWRFLDCEERQPTPLAESPARGNFLDSALRVIESPRIEQARPDPAGTITLAWTAHTGARYVLEEASRPDWQDAAQVYSGEQSYTTIYGRSDGAYFYRVRALVEGFSSNWSEGVGVRVEAASAWQLQSPSAYDALTLLEVQCALLRMCAARGDLFAVLSLPEHYREEDAARHVASLKPKSRENFTGAQGASLIAPLGYGELRALSFGALYHPWLISREGERRQDLRRSPPDGAAAGVLAGRAFTRGAWISPANENLREVVALAPPPMRAYLQLLQDAQVNAIRQEPRGFLALSADTLSEDVDYRPISVRRLLSLLRRIALRLGATYVFEPNNDAFRRLVRRSFEEMLDEMFRRGAFAGTTSGSSFQVVTSAALNTPQSVDEGRFIVELKVAPSLPLTFLTIRLVQAGGRGLLIEER